MNNTTDSAKPYTTREAFLIHGLREIHLDTALDCSICREPLMVVLGNTESIQPNVPSSAVMSLSHVAVTDNISSPCPDKTVLQNQPFTTTGSTEDGIVPESAVRILPCQHIFGRTCLKAWFTSSNSNRCPECNQELFSNRYMHLVLREPTRSMRVGFADYLEEVCGDSETADEIRDNLMSDWTRSLIREVAMELWRGQGYEVGYQYVSGEPIGEEGDEEMTDGEYEESDELETDGSEGNETERTHSQAG